MFPQKAGKWDFFSDENGNVIHILKVSISKVVVKRGNHLNNLNRNFNE